MHIKNKVLFQFTGIILSLMLLAGCGDPAIDSSLSKYTPKGLVTSPGTRTVTLNWSGVGGASRYTVYWSHNEDVSKSNGAVITTTDPYLEHTDLANDTTYYYVVTAHVSTGESRASARVSATPKPAAPEQPEDFKVKAEDGRVTLTWQEGTLGAEITETTSGYSLYWDTQNTLNPEIDSGTQNRVENVSTPFVHSALTNGQRYYYYLVAENQYGQSTATPVLTAQPQKPAPMAPIITAAVVSGGQIELQWQTVSNAEAFDIYWNTQGNVGTVDTKISQVTSPYFHTPLSDGTAYYYRIQARNSSGASALSNEASATPPDASSVVIQVPAVALPAVPQINEASFHDSRIKLTWTPITGATAYNLYWKSDFNDGGVTQADNVIRNIQSPYTHIGLSNGTPYYYRLSAINDGGESALSDEVNAVPQVVVPGVPAGVTALAGNGWIAVRWTDVDKASEYNVYLDGGEVASNVRSPYTLQGLSNGTSYDITIAALNGGALSEQSAPVSATPQLPPPYAPENITAQPQDGQVTVQWDSAQPQDPSDTISAYQVHYRTRSGVTPGNGTLLTVIPSQDANNRWQIFHSGLSNGQRYYYVVTALNADGSQSGLSAEVWARPQVPIPDAPNNVWTQAGDNQIVIYFTPAENALSHNLYWTKGLGDGTRSDAQVLTNFQPGGVFTDGNANGNTYYFQVAAFNNGGESARTPEVDATPQIPVPQSPPQNIASQSGDAQVALNWDAQAEATQGYVIYWSTEPQIDPSTSESIKVDAATTTYTHIGLQNGQSYFYQIVAVNEGGGSALSEAVVARPQMPPPAAPTQAPTANAGDGVITLTWADAPTATSYTLYRSTNIEALLNQWARLDGVLPGYIDSGLNNNQFYNYILTASNPGGESGPSSAATARPLAPLPDAPQGLIVIAGNSQVSLDWDTQIGLNYTLYWNANPAVDPINDSNTPLSNVRPATLHRSLANDTSYRYQLTANNATGEGLPTPIVTATPTNGIPNNTPPVIQQGASIAVVMDEDNAPPLVFDLTLNATDADNNTLQWRVSRDAGNGDASVVAEGMVAPVLYSPNPNFNGNDSFIVEVNDGQGGTASTLVNVTVQSVNDAPVFASAPGDRSNSAGDTITTFIVSASDVADNDIIRYTAINLPTGISINANTGEISGQISANISTQTAFSVTVTANDQSGQANATANARFNWVVNSNAGVTVTTAGGTTLSEIPASSINISVVLDSQPGADVTISATSSAATTEASVAPTSLTFTNTNWATPQNFVVSSIDDGRVDGDQFVQIALTMATADAQYSLIDPNDVTVTVIDNTVPPTINQKLLGISSGMLVSVDGLTRKVTPRSGLGLAGFSGVKQISYDHVNKLLYGINELPKASPTSTLKYTQIVEIDPVTSVKRVYGYTGSVFLNSVGMAVDPNANVIYSLNANGDFYSYNLITKTTSAVSNIGFSGVTGLAIDVLGGGTLYTIQTSTNQLVSITSGGIASIINTLTSNLIVPKVNLSAPASLSFDPNTDQIIAAVPTIPNIRNYFELMAIDKITAQATNVGGFFVRGGEDISLAYAYDPLVLTNNTAYFIPRLTNKSGILHKINLPAYGGQKIKRIPIPFGKLSALATDRNSRDLYGLDEQSKSIFKYSAGTVTVEAQADIPNTVSALAMDPNRANTIYVANRTDLYTIDTITWNVTYVGAFGTNIIDMAFDPNSGVLYGVDNATSNSGLVTINTTTGVASAPIAITGTSSSKPILGIGFSEPVAGSYQLHGISNLRRIYSIDPSTGVATNIDTSKSISTNITNITFDGNNLIAAFGTSIKSVDITNLSGASYVETEVVEHTYSGNSLNLTFDPDLNTFYAASSGAFSNLYSVDPLTGLGAKLGSLSYSLIDIAYDPITKQLYGVASQSTPDTVLLSISTSGTGALDTYVAIIKDTNYLSGITFDSLGDLYGVVGNSTSTSDLIKVDKISGEVVATTQIPYSNGGNITFNSSSSDFIITSANAPYNLAQLSKTGSARRIAELKASDIAYQNSTATIFHFSDDFLPTINTSKTDLSTTPVMSTGSFTSTATAHDDSSNTLYMINNDTGNLLRIDKITGQPLVVGFTELTNITGLVFDPLSPPGEELFGYDNGNTGIGQFIALDPNTGIATTYPGLITGITDFAIDIAADGSSSTIYADSNGRTFATVNLTTKTLNNDAVSFTAGGNITYSNIRGISIDAAGNMYGVAQLDNSDYYILDIDKATGIVTHALKKTGFGALSALGMDKNTNTMYSSNLGSGYLVSINPVSGAATTRGALGGFVNRLVYSPSNSTFYGIRESTNRLLYSVDPTNGSTTFIDGLRSNSIPAVSGFAVNPNSLTFYSSDNASPQNLSMFSTTASTGLAVFNINGEVGIKVNDLEWNSAKNSLFGLSKSSNRLFQITTLTTDTATGALIGPSIGTASYNSLVYSPANNAFITVENETGLLVIDETTGEGAAQIIPLIGDLPAVHGITYQP